MKSPIAPLIALVVSLLVFTATSQAQAQAEYSERFDDFEVHHSVVNTTFLSPEVAASYQIIRGKQRAILNLAFREHVSEQGTEARQTLLKGRTWDLIHEQELDFKEIREEDAIYYIAEFKFINEEWRFFEVYFRPDGAEQTYTFKFKHQLYIN